MNNKMTTKKNNTNKNNTLIEVIINDPESKMRIGIQAIEDLVKNKSRNRRIHAPLTVEERALLNF